jgi:hypothetical protein
MKYGYARVSPGGKSESVDAQALHLTRAGCKKAFHDVHVSGAITDRLKPHRAIAALKPGEVLTVTRLDRLAHSTRDLLNTLAAIAERKAGFTSLGDAWADTTIGVTIRRAGSIPSLGEHSSYRHGLAWPSHPRLCSTKGSRGWPAQVVGLDLTIGAP